MERQIRQSALLGLALIVVLMWCHEMTDLDQPEWAQQQPPWSARLAFPDGDSNHPGVGRIIGGMQADSDHTTDPDAGDVALVRDALNGSRTAFSGLYFRHAGWLKPLLWRLTGGDHALAEDLLQEAFVQAWQKLDQLREPERFGGWLKQLAINLALADRRRIHITGSDDALPHLADIQPPWPAADLDLERAIARLPARAREVLVLFCLEGHSHEEIATLLKVEIGTSKAQLHRARGLLKETLSHEA